MHRFPQIYPTVISEIYNKLCLYLSILLWFPSSKFFNFSSYRKRYQHTTKEKSFLNVLYQCLTYLIAQSLCQRIFYIYF